MTKSWIVKGYCNHVAATKHKGIFTQYGEAEADAVRLTRAALDEGYDEIIILRRGLRNATSSRDAYYQRVRRQFAVDVLDEVKADGE